MPGVQHSGDRPGNHDHADKLPFVFRADPKLPANRGAVMPVEVCHELAALLKGDGDRVQRGSILDILSGCGVI